MPPELIVLVDYLDASRVTAHQIERSTKHNPDLALEYVQHGRPSMSTIPLTTCARIFRNGQC